jgi:hypothetical protein
MKTKKRLLLLFAGISCSFFSCYVNDPDSLDELDLVLTNYDNTVAFQGHPTYAIPDKVVEITGNYLAGQPVKFLDEPYSSIIINRIKSNMTAMGYSEVTDTTQADFIMLASELEVTNISYYYDYWYWYYPGYYGWYYPYSVAYSYTTGTVMMNLIRRDVVSPGGKLHVAWTGVVNGVLDGYSADATSRLNKTIDQAFAQSQYLQQ